VETVLPERIGPSKNLFGGAVESNLNLAPNSSAKGGKKRGAKSGLKDNFGLRHQIAYINIRSSIDLRKGTEAQTEEHEKN